jgi:hypothetical protein
VTLAPSDQLTLTMEKKEGSLMSRRDRRVEKVRRWLRRFRLDTGMKHFLHDELPGLLDHPDRLAAYELSDAQMNVIQSVLRQ